MLRHNKKASLSGMNECICTCSYVFVHKFKNSICECVSLSLILPHLCTSISFHNFLFETKPTILRKNRNSFNSCVCVCVFFVLGPFIHIDVDFLRSRSLTHISFPFNLISGEAGEIVFPVTNLLACYFVQTLSKLKKNKELSAILPQKMDGLWSPIVFHSQFSIVL